MTNHTPSTEEREKLKTLLAKLFDPAKTLDEQISLLVEYRQEVQAEMGEAVIARHRQANGQWEKTQSFIQSYELQRNEDPHRIFATAKASEAALVENEELKLAIEWLLSGDTGVSSKTLCAHMLGMHLDGYQAPPADEADRRRCVKLLQLFPKWQDRLDELANIRGQISYVIDSQGERQEYNSWRKQIPLISQALSINLDQEGKDE